MPAIKTLDGDAFTRSLSRAKLPTTSRPNLRPPGAQDSPALGALAEVSGESQD